MHVETPAKVSKEAPSGVAANQHGREKIGKVRERPVALAVEEPTKPKI
jgi:hypothetical protein